MNLISRILVQGAVVAVLELRLYPDNEMCTEGEGRATRAGYLLLSDTVCMLELRVRMGGERYSPDCILPWWFNK